MNKHRCDPVLRPTLLSDSRQIHQIMGELRSPSQASGAHLPCWSLTQIEAECAFSKGLACVDANSQILGFLLYRTQLDALEIVYLATRPSARRLGVMRKVVSALIKILPAEKSIWLEVHEENQPARKLYEALGFFVVGRRPRFYADHGTAVLYNYG